MSTEKKPLPSTEAKEESKAATTGASTGASTSSDSIDALIAESAKATFVVLGKDAILSAHDIEREYVSVDEWQKGAKVLVTGLSATERDAFEESCIHDVRGEQKFSRANIRAKLCARTIVDEDGRRIFTDADIPALGRKSAAVLDRIFTVAMRLSKISSEDVDKLEKNSASDLSDEP